MNGILKSSLLLVLLYDVDVFSAVASGSASILSFSFEVKDSVTGRWKSSNSIKNGTYTRLNCITLSDSPSSTVHIRRINETEPLRPVISSGGQVLYEFGNIGCDRMGTYVCEDEGEGGSHRNLDLGILQCKPQLCKGSSSNQTLFARENKSTAFSLCVTAYENISGLEVRNNGRTIAGTAWRSELQTFATHRLFVELPNALGLSYGVHALDVVVVYGTQMEETVLDFKLELSYFGIPDCPTIDPVQTRSLRNVTLTWLPGSGKGAKQIFYVYSSTDLKTWQSEGNTSDNWRIITGLQEDVRYIFRVISAHKFMQNINGDMCKNDLYYTPGAEVTRSSEKMTIPTASPVTNGKESAFPSTEVWVAIVVVLLNIIVVIVIIAIVIHIRKNRLLRTPEREREDFYAPESRSSCTTENTGSLMSESESSDYYQNGRKEHVYEEVP